MLTAAEAARILKVSESWLAGKLWFSSTIAKDLRCHFGAYAAYPRGYYVRVSFFGATQTGQLCHFRCETISEPDSSGAAMNERRVVDSE